MNDHIDDELPLVLSGEADRDTVMSVVAHLRQCRDCVEELLSLLIAHASLSSAARFAPEVVAIAVEHEQTSRPTPDLSAMFARVAAEVDIETIAATSRRPRHTGRWLAAAATVIVVAGGTAAIVTSASSSSGPATDVALSAYDIGTKPARAVVTGSQMKLDASSLPTLPSGELYEVWLTNAERTSMHPLGWVGPDGNGTYTVPAPLMNHFSAIEVSVQKVAAPDGYSGTSVLRGTY